MVVRGTDAEAGRALQRPPSLARARTRKSSKKRASSITCTLQSFADGGLCSLVDRLRTWVPADRPVRFSPTRLVIRKKTHSTGSLRFTNNLNL